MDYNSYGGGGGGQSYNTSYGAAGDTHGGGGFVRGGGGGGGGGGGENPSSQAGGQGSGRDYSNETCRPVTVAQVLSGSHAHLNAPFKIDGEQASHVKLVAQVRSIQTLETHTLYKVDDGTGIVDVKQWITAREAGEYDGDDDDMEMDMDINGGAVAGTTEKKAAGGGIGIRKKKEIKEQDYVRIWGIPKEFNGKRHVHSHSISPITDYDEINYHLLEATSVHLYFTRGPPQQLQQKDGQKQEDGSVGGGGGGSGGDGGGALPSSVSPGARKVIQALRAAHNNEGLNVHTIASNSGMNLSDVYTAVDELVQEGIIFTTLDDETYAILDAPNM